MAGRYLFIDGGFLDSMIARAERDFNLPAPISLDVRGFTQFTYQRIFYYDAYPAPKENQTTEEYKHLVDLKNAKFAALNQTPSVHTREGVTRNRTGKGARLEQKGVDMLMAIDAYKHAAQGNIDAAHILTTDLDFFPLLEALRDTRVATFLHCYVRETSPDLYHLADVVLPVNRLQMAFHGGYRDIIKSSVEKIPAADLKNPALIKEGRLSGKPLYLYEDPNGLSGGVIGHSFAYRKDQAFRARDIEGVIEYLELMTREPVFF